MPRWGIMKDENTQGARPRAPTKAVCLHIRS